MLFYKRNTKKFPVFTYSYFNTRESFGEREDCVETLALRVCLSIATFIVLPTSNSFLLRRRKIHLNTENVFCIYLFVK